MKIEGHRLRDLVRLLAPLFELIAAVWALRLMVFAAGARPGSVWLHVISVTVTGAVSILLALLMIHHRRFGSYTSVVVAVFLLIAWEELLISAAIAFATITGTVNVYSVAKYSFGRAPWHHIAAQLTLILGSRTILGAAMGCLLLWMLRRVDPMEGQKAAGGRGKAVGSRY
ncbi:MAG: hypothetical protein ACLQOO_36195 [Terriglobia bacterium]